MSNEKLPRAPQKASTHFGSGYNTHNDTIQQKRLPLQNKQAESYGLGIQVTPLNGSNSGIKSAGLRPPRTNATPPNLAKSKKEQMAEIMSHLRRNKSTSSTKLPPIIKPKAESRPQKAEKLARKPPRGNVKTRLNKLDNPVLKMERPIYSAGNSSRQSSAESTRFSLNVKQSGLYTNDELDRDISSWNDDKADEKLASMDYQSESTNVPSIPSIQQSITSVESSANPDTVNKLCRDARRDSNVPNLIPNRDGLSFIEQSQSEPNKINSQVSKHSDASLANHNCESDSLEQPKRFNFDESGGFGGFEDDASGFSIEDYVASQKLQQKL